ncbi:DUF1460 domain-containing protein [candidate division WOR-3 bacterium]|nr:DUF1460 domain-containing protein [candidate division WOR-3 bacterium]
MFLFTFNTLTFLLMSNLTPESVEYHISRINSEELTLGQRVQYFSCVFLGTKYELGPLGEGEETPPDTDPLYDFEKVDCVTFCEQVIALSLAKQGFEDFLDILTHIRYKNGVVSFEARNHYTYVDWIPNNSWLCSDVTGSVGPVRIINKTIDKENFFTGHGLTPSEEHLPVEIEILYIDEGDISAVSFGEGDLIMIVTSRPGIDIAHWGFFLKNPNVFRHASMSKGMVTDLPWESFVSYLKDKDDFLGLVVVRLLEKPLCYWREDATFF